MKSVRRAVKIISAMIALFGAVAFFFELFGSKLSLLTIIISVGFIGIVAVTSLIALLILGWVGELVVGHELVDLVDFLTPVIAVGAAGVAVVLLFTQPIMDFYELDPGKTISGVLFGLLTALVCVLVWIPSRE